MATSYSTLKTEIVAFYNRTDLSSVVDTFIDLCESEMQVECKSVEFEATSTVVVTAGVAALPADWLGGRTAQFLGDTPRTLVYRPPEGINTANAAGLTTPLYYTITGSSLKFAEDGDGSVLLTYHAKFTPLDDTNTTNAILASFPGAYLFGSLKYAAVYMKDVQGASGYDALFQEQLDKIRKNNAQRKYSGPLAVRCA
jgi:hypothetical protein